MVGYNPGDGSESSSKIVVETECRRRRWWDRWYESGCRYWDETLSDDGRYCCWEEEYEVEEQASGNAYFKIQNSWGTGWGDNGFMYLAVEDGRGACGMNEEVEWVEPLV